MSLPIIIISYKSLSKIKKCLSNLGNKNEVLIIENSSDNEIKHSIENEYINCKVIINQKNLGYGKAANIALNEIKTKYALILEPDVKIDENQIIKIENEISLCEEDFALATPLYDDLIDFNKNNNFDKDLSKINININETKTKIDLIKGCSLIVNLDKFKTEKVFDENFFFFYEDIDLCKRIKKMGENIFVFNKIKIVHEGAQGVSSDINQEYLNFRHWNYYWSRFYYHKKHYGYITSFLQHISKLIRFFVSYAVLYFFSKERFIKNKYRFLGLFSSMIGIKSSKSKNILTKK